MRTGASFGWKHAIALLAIAAVASVAFASVFVLYGGSVTAYFQKPPVVWGAGDNSNATDLGGQTITVLVGPNSTQLQVTLHPTYEYTYYKNITIIKNNDATNGYYIAVRVTSPANVTRIAGASVKLILYNATSTEVIDLTTSGVTPWYYLPAGSHVSVDVQYYLPSGVALPKSVVFQIQLIYSPSNTESPPATV